MSDRTAEPADETALSDLAALIWQCDAGADEAMAAAAIDRFLVPEQVPARLGERDETAGTRGTTASGPDGPKTTAQPSAAETARAVAAKCTTLDALQAALQSFTGLPIRETATNMVFASGNPAAEVMMIGEAPGGEEDRYGEPFVGRSGQLLDRMTAAIGLDRRHDDPAHGLYITNIVNWRPPGNRKPTDAEIVASLPFVLRHIALANPRVVVPLGGTAAAILLQTSQGITKLRGRWTNLAIHDRAFACLPTFHPAYLLRTPAAKKQAWLDLLAIRRRLREGQ